MNYDQFNKVSDFMRESIWPFLTNRLIVPDFSYYLNRYSTMKSTTWLKNGVIVLPTIYSVDAPSFIKEYSKKCVSFMGSQDPSDGILQIIYQMNPNIHVLAKLFVWEEQKKINSHCMLLAAFKDISDYLKFYDENKKFRLEGNTDDEKIAGFGNIGGAVGFQSGIGIE